MGSVLISFLPGPIPPPRVPDRPMPILTHKTVWRRHAEPSPRRSLVRLTPDECANVRRVIAHLTVEHGAAGLARALGITRDALGKARVPSRPQSPRMVFALARLTELPVDAILAGVWAQSTCPHCGCNAYGAPSAPARRR